MKKYLAQFGLIRKSLGGKNQVGDDVNKIVQDIITQFGYPVVTGTCCPTQATTPTDDQVLAYNATTKKIEFVTLGNYQAQGKAVSAATYTLLPTDYVVQFTGTGTVVTLPAATAFPGRQVTLVNHGSGAVTSTTVAKTAAAAAAAISVPITAGSNMWTLQSIGGVWVRIA